MIQPELRYFDAPSPSKILPNIVGSSAFSQTHKIAYYTYGCGDKIVFCIHGMTRNSRDFDYLANSLVDDGYKVIAVDMAGRGNSEYLENSKHYNYSTYCNDIRNLCNNLNLRNINVVGTSMGGLIAMMLAFEDSSTPADKRLFAKMVLNDIGAFIPSESLKRIGSYIGKSVGFASRELLENQLRNSMQGFGLNKDEYWDHLFKHSIIQDEDGTYRTNYDPKISDAFRTKSGKSKKIPDMDFWKIWNVIQTPTLLLRGSESDLLLRETAERMSQSKNIIKFVEFDGVGHAPMLMDDEQINVVRDFLSKYTKNTLL